MVEMRVTLHLPDDLYNKIKGDLDNELGRCAEMSFIFLKMFNFMSDTHPEAIQGAVDGLGRIEDARLRSFLETYGDE